MTSKDIPTAVDCFLCGLADLPTYQSMDEILEKALHAERELRRLFACDPHNRMLRDPFIGLMDVFKVDASLRRARAREISSESDLLARYILPVSSSFRKPNMMPSTVLDIEGFRENWDLFTHGVLSKMSVCDWKNVLAAGGSVLACLAPPQPATPRKSLNELFQSKTYATSNVDLFLWGLSPEEAKVKMEDIYQAVCAASPWNVICIRKAHVVLIHTMYPYRPVQIVLRLYQSPAEILAGFDIDSACCAYDEAGHNVWVNPRSLAAIIRQVNTVDITRRSPSYELRLAKFAERHFEINLPSLNRAEIDFSVYDPALTTWPKGLARLLVLERAYQESNFYNLLKYPMVPLLQEASQANYAGVCPLTGISYDYALGIAQIPYGPLWDADAVAELISELVR
ncbi:hypothetical protein CVT26_011468 [Gymnopilus dilepis]|uniref:Uncharacterized protein n=1 Tax=Gymnopilus dilepis TaxID=231916 RepID=A0A409W8P5_9AGAR|nr:hypothetical protein CVT26_011468 [Gymnopilus dilepis]